jgi:hypothetical protein
MTTSSRHALAAALAVTAAMGFSFAQGAEVALAPRSVVNQSGSTVESGGARWLGTGANAAASRLGMIFAVPDLPRTAFRSATLLLTAAWTQWIPVDVEIAAELSPNPADFGPRALPSNRALTTLAARYAENTRWGANGVYEIDVTEPVRAVLARFGHPSAIALIAAGQGTPWGRKFFATGAAPPSLRLTFEDPPAPPPSPVVSAERDAPSAAMPAPSSAAAM